MRIIAALLIVAGLGGELQAKRIDADLKRGVNIIGYDPIWQKQERGRFKAEHFRLIKEAGFDHVRVNLHPFRHMDGDHKLPERWFAVLDWVVEQCKANGLSAMLDCHEFTEMAKDPNGNKERWLAFWRQVAGRYRDEPEGVLFELLNEPHGKLTPELWNEYLQEAHALVRGTNPERRLVVGPGGWNSMDALKALSLPADPNIIITFHYYSPFKFTHQGASWAGNPPTGVKWKGSAKQREAMEWDFDRVAKWSEENGRQLYLGEFGAYDKAEMPSRARWTAAVRQAAEKRGIGWGYWQFDSDFVVYDIDKGEWVADILGALIPEGGAVGQ